MKSTRLFAAIGLLVAAAAWTQESGGQNSQASENENKQAHELDVRYAQTMLALAKLELQRGLQINQQIPGTFTKTAINALEQVVVIDEEQVKALTQPGSARVPLYLIAAQSSAKAAQQSLERVLAINQQNPGTITQIEVDRLRLNAELSHLALEKARSINPKNEAQFLQWQIDQLRDELLQLRNRMAQLSRMN